MLSAFKNFGVTFLIAAVVFGFIAYFATGLVTNTVNQMLEDENNSLSEIMQNDDSSAGDNETKSGESSDPAIKVPKGESFNFMIAVSDYRPEEYNDYIPQSAHMYDTDWNNVKSENTIGCLSSDYRKSNITSIILVTASKEKREYCYTYICPYIRVFSQSGYHTLSEIYELYGLNKLSEYVYSMTGLYSKYNTVINAYNLDELYSIIGGISTVIDKDIYSDGKYYTMQYETTAERKAEDGSVWVEHKPNTYVIGKGEVTLNQTNILPIFTAQEHSVADISAKEQYMTDILHKYLNLLACMDEDNLKIVLAQLITKESEWANIEGLELPEKAENPTEEPNEPAEIDNFENDEDTYGKNRWLNELSEPDDAIIRTSFTLNDFDDIYEMLCAVSYFDKKVTAYPVTYIAPVEDIDEYFEADINSAVEALNEYRK